MLQLVKTKNYLLLIDEEAEIKGKGWRVDLERNTLGFIDSDEYYNRTENKNKFALVVGYYPLTKEAKELNLPLLPNSFEEVNIKKLAKYHYGNNRKTIEHEEGFLLGFDLGYKAAQSKQFSLEDVVRIAHLWD